MIATHDSLEPHPPSFLGGVVSMAFWLCLGTSALLFAIVVAAPRITEWNRLERRWQQASEQIRALKADVRHLQLLKDSIQNDPEFAARVAQDELNLSTTGSYRLRVDESLGFDPHERHTVPSEPVFAETWYEPLLAELAQSTQLRARWLMCTGALCLLSFVLLHEGTFQGRVGGGLMRALRKTLRRYEPLPAPAGEHTAEEAASLASSEVTSS